MLKMNFYSSRHNDHDGCGVIVLAILGLIALAFLSPLITMWLWNWVAVEMFALPVITYWKAVGLTWLCHILFGHTVTVKRD
jgi:hypothetical protein